MNGTLEERKKKAAEEAEDEWNKEQEEKRKMEEKEGKLAEIKNAKLDLPKPKKTGWSMLEELFEAVVGEEESSSVHWAIMSGDYCGIFRATKSGVIESFMGMPIPKELTVAPLSGKARDELMDFVAKHPQKGEEKDFIAMHGNPLIMGGCLTQTWILRRKFALPLYQIPVFKTRSDEVDKIFMPGHFIGFACGVVNLASFIEGVIAADKQFTYELSTTNFYAKPVYSLTTPLLQLNFPLSNGVFTRLRDRSIIILERPFEYKTRELALNIGDFAKQAEIAKKLEQAVEQKWQTLKELFDYWKLLNKELEKLNSLYRTAKTE